MKCMSDLITRWHSRKHSDKHSKEAAQNPDDVVKKDIVSTDFMTLKAVGSVPTPPAGQISLYPDQTTGNITVRKSDGSTVNLEATGGSATAREDLVAFWDVSSIKTNIGITFVDVYTQANSDGKSVQIDTNGKTQVKLQVNWNKVGTDVGTQTVQVLEVGTANVLITMTVIAGKNTSALTAIPAFATNTVKFYKLQCKSTTAADDPVFESARVYLK